MKSTSETTGKKVKKEKVCKKNSQRRRGFKPLLAALGGVLSLSPSSFKADRLGCSEPGIGDEADMAKRRVLWM